MLKQILSLPTNTPDAAEYMVSGFLPVEAQVDKRVLSLFHNVTLLFHNVTLQDDSSVEKQLANLPIDCKR